MLARVLAALVGGMWSTIGLGHAVVLYRLAPPTHLYIVVCLKVLAIWRRTVVMGVVFIACPWPGCAPGFEPCLGMTAARLTLFAVGAPALEWFQVALPVWLRQFMVLNPPHMGRRISQPKNQSETNFGWESLGLNQIWLGISPPPEKTYAYTPFAVTQCLTTPKGRFSAIFNRSAKSTYFCY